MVSVLLLNPGGFLAHWMFCGILFGLDQSDGRCPQSAGKERRDEDLKVPVMGSSWMRGRAALKDADLLVRAVQMLPTHHGAWGLHSASLGQGFSS